MTVKLYPYDPADPSRTTPPSEMNEVHIQITPGATSAETYEIARVTVNNAIKFQLGEVGAFIDGEIVSGYMGCGINCHEAEEVAAGVVDVFVYYNNNEAGVIAAANIVFAALAP